MNFDIFLNIWLGCLLCLKIVTFFWPYEISHNINCNLCYFWTGVVTLLKDYEVCKEGDVLTPEQTRILVSSWLLWHG